MQFLDWLASAGLVFWQHSGRGSVCGLAELFNSETSPGSGRAISQSVISSHNVHAISLYLVCYYSYVCYITINPIYWLIQGLSDPEEFVVHKTLGALTALTELGLIQKSMLQEFLQEVVPFLAHPVSVWLMLYHTFVYDTPCISIWHLL